MSNCKHEKMILVKYKNINNYTRQCVVCGKTTGAIALARLTAEEKATAPIIDDSIATNYWAQVRAQSLEKRQQEENIRHREWLREHDDYLRSPAWASRRAAVLRRDGYICQACLVNPATEVHHISYRYWREEPLFHLVSVCRLCHDKITAMDREKQGRDK